MLALNVIPIVFTLALVVACALISRKFVRSVSDFLAGGRAAGRYLICNAKGESGSGVANTMARFQVIFLSGFVLSWWDAISMPILLFVGITGFVAYRYRQTRALTLGQFFEMRYSRRFRLFAGGLGFTAGLLNYGIFPAIGANFFVYFLGWPVELHVLGVAVPTYMLIMAAYLATSLWLMAAGGQVALMLADSISGIVSHALYVALVFAVLGLITWSQARDTLLAVPAGQSLVNPFDASKVADFNFGYALMTLLLNIYGTMAWQSGHNFNSAARSPHELRMGNVLGYWRVYARQVMLVVLAIAAYTFLKHGHFAAAAAPAKAEIANIASEQLRTQMTVPVALRYLLPVWAKLLLCTVMWLGLVSGDASHLLSWGSIFIQDVVLPLRRKPMTQAEHVRWLKWAVAGVTLFGFVFSSLFHQTQYIYLWWAVTTGVFASGAGAAIIGGLYWRRGTIAAAWAAMICGAVVSLTGIVAKQIHPNFPLNGTQTSFVAAGLSLCVFFAVSLLRRERFDLDTMLHRDQQPAGRPQFQLFNFNADFTRIDRIISGGILIWSGAWLVVVVVGTAWNHWQPWSTSAWTSYWLAVGVILPLAVALITLFWFGIGGFLDLKILFAKLMRPEIDVRDDGTVPQRDRAGYEPHDLLITKQKTLG